MTTAALSSFIREQAYSLGFDACGFARASALPEEESALMESWRAQDCHGEMAYMARNLDKRLNPQLLVENCRSIVSVALNYFPLEKQLPNSPKVAKFAYGLDYHDLIRQKLTLLMEHIRGLGLIVNGRAFSDSAPVMERYWAWKAGIGWMGKNHQLIVPGCGSHFFLGELLIDLDLEYGKPLPSRCGSCSKCRDACPTNALNETHLDARRCISYLTIEKKGDFSTQEADWMGKTDWVFGCDICQEVCPWNRFSAPHSTPELRPSDLFLSLDNESLHALDGSSFKACFSGTCLERTGLKGLKRNLDAIKKSRNPLKETGII